MGMNNMNCAVKLPDYEGGFITKEVRDGWIYTYDNGGYLLNVQPVNYVHKGVECKYGKVKEYADNVVILEKGGKFGRMEKGKLNDYLMEVGGGLLVVGGRKPEVSGTFGTVVGNVRVESEIEEARAILTEPDRVFINRKTYTFEKAIEGERYILRAEKGIAKSIRIEKNKVKLLFKGMAVAAEPKQMQAEGGNAWNQRGGMKPGHKYIQRKEAGTKPDGSPKYIYLYELPSGERQWRDENGKPAQKQEAGQEYKPEFEAGEMVRQGDKVGKVVETSENFLAVNFEGKIEVVNKKEHMEKIKEHELYKEGDETTYEGQAAKILKVTDNLALIKTKNDNRLRVISLEKQFQKAESKGQSAESKGQKKEEPLDDYEQTAEYQKFWDTAERDGFGRVDNVRARKFIKVGNTVHSVEWRYNPDLKEIGYYVDGQRDKTLNFMGEQFKVRDITDKGFSLENEAGETGLFLSHKDYEKAVEGTDQNIYEHEIEDLGENVGEIIHSPKRTFHFSGKLSDEQLKRIEEEKQRAKPGRRMVMRRSQEPLQTEAQKAAIEAERQSKQAQIKEALGSKSYADFDKAMKERGFEIGENKFTGSKKIEIGGKKFEVNAKYKPDDGVWETNVSGPHEKLKLGEKEYPVTDLSKDKVYYQDGGDEKAISIKDLEEINGKSIFEPTKASKGIISTLPPQRFYFSTDEKDSAAGYYEIVSTDDLIASHKPGGETNKNYSISDAQNRDRGTAQSLAQINKIAANPNFDFLSDNKFVMDGAPIVNQDYNVIAGNARAIGMQQHYGNGGDKYRQDLLKNAERLGFKKGDIEKIKDPVLVRRMNIDNKEAQRLGAISNTSNMLAPEAREEAKGKATRIDDRTFNNLAGIFEKAKGERNSISDYLDEVGPEIVKELVSKKIIPENEQHLYFNSSTGKLDASHKDKVKELLTQSILGDSSREFERIPDAAREGMSKALGDIFSLKGKGGDLVPHLQNAVKILAKYNAVKDKFSSPDTFIDQDANNAFEPLSASKEDLALFDLMTSGKPNEIKSKIREYKQLMEGDMFSEGMTPEEAFKKAFEPKYENGIGMGVNKGFWNRIKLFGKRILKSADVSRLQLIPSRKNPSVKRWQRMDVGGRGLEVGGRELEVREIKPVFYSKLQKLIREKMASRMPAEQLRNLIKGNFIPEEEIKWSGIEDYLKDKGNVEKNDVLNFLKGNELKIEEVIKGNNILNEEGKQKDLSFLEELENGGATKLENTNPYGIWNVELVDNKYKIYKTGHGGNIFEESVETPEEVINYIERQGYYKKGDAKYTRYKLPGGENYKEILFTLPNSKGLTNSERVEFEDLLSKKRTWKLQLEDIKRYNELSERAYNDRQEGFKSNHFDEPNILAHARIDDRIDAQGKKVLFIEEVQSDWGQAGRKRGFTQNGELEKLKSELDKAMIDYNKLDFNKLKLSEIWETPEGKKVNELKDKIEKLENTVPDMPFKKDWHEFVLKRLLREAAEKGYDKLAWTTGEQQAERYDLSKQVKSIEWQPSTKELYVTEIENPDSYKKIADNVTEQNLENYVGKEVAKWMLDEKSINKNNDTWRVARGENLKIGGEGMKGFYDKIIPDFLNKYGKKWNAKVGEINLTHTNTYEGLKARGQEVMDRLGITQQEFDALPLEERYRLTNQNTEVHSIDITPEMREDILYKGQPIFGKSKKIIMLGRRVLIKSIDTTKNILMPSKKNPDVKRWQNTSTPAKAVPFPYKGEGKKRTLTSSEDGKKNAEYPKSLDKEGIMNFIEENKLRDSSGRIDYNTAKEIAGGADKFILKEIPLEKFDWVVEPRKRKNNLPIIALDLGDGDFEILDGKHRIGEANVRGEKSILAYVGINNDQISELNPKHNKGDKDILEEAREYAGEKHAGQRYNDGDYFKDHLTPVAEKAREIANSGKMTKRGQDEVEAAAYLHDVLEDTKTRSAEIEERFGKEVGDAVKLLSTKIVDDGGERKPKDEYYRGIAGNLTARIVKVADRIVNICALGEVKDPVRRKKLYDKYKGEMKYFEEYGIYAKIVGEELQRAEVRGQKSERQIDSEAFKNWFGESKVVDKDGWPLVVYHGTNKKFSEFKKEGNYYFTDNKSAAKKYGKEQIAAYLKMKNPKIIDYRGEMDNDLDAFDIPEAVEGGYDGVIALNTSDGFNILNQYVVFYPNQIKTATENDGNFDPDSADITKGIDSKELKEGKEIEGEHENLYNELKKRLEEEGAKMPMSKEEFFEWIAKQHISETKDYYYLLKKYVE